MNTKVIFKLLLLSVCLSWHYANAVPIEDTTVGLTGFVDEDPSLTDPLLMEDIKVIFTSVLFRHGDRMPLPLCPNDPNSDPALWPKDWEQLSNLGAQQLYSLGQFLRKRYGSILSTTYKPTEIYVRSTDVDRTIASALSCLAGLYPPLLNEMWNKDIRWQPIPVHTVDRTVDYLLGWATCPKHTLLLDQLMAAHGFTVLLEASYGDISQKCGKPITSYSDLVHLYDGLKVEEIYGMTLPDWTKSFYGNPIWENLYYLMFVKDTYTPEMARLRGGPLIKEILHNMQAKVDGELDQSMMMYSGHDTTVAALLNSLNMLTFEGPPYPRPGYGSVVMMDLVMDSSNSPQVIVSFRNDTYSDAELLSFKGCGTMCPLSKVFSLFNDILPDDIVAECEAE